MSKDAEIFDRVMGYVKDRRVAVDVGAHKGVWTEKMALSFGKVHCFEPNVDLFDRLFHWVVNSFDNVVVSSRAILDRNSHGSLCFPVNSTNKTRGFYVVDDGFGDIRINRLDSFGIEGCGLLKVDIEGGELLALRGAENLLCEQGPVVVVEYKEITSARFGWTEEELYKYMKDLNYEIVFSEKPNLVFERTRK